MCKSILNTLRIKDKNLNFSDEVTEKNHKGRMSLFYYAEFTYQPHIVKIVQLKIKIFYSKNSKKTSTITLLKIMEMPAYLELQNKDFIVNHVTVILLLNLILSTLIVLFLIKQNLQF